MASVKNFQLVMSDPLYKYSEGANAQEALLKYDADHEYLVQMGKVSHCYHSLC